MGKTKGQVKFTIQVVGQKRSQVYYTSCWSKKEKSQFGKKLKFSCQIIGPVALVST